VRAVERAARPETISSRENRWLKVFRAALRNTGAPAEWVGLEGPRLVEEAIRAGMRLGAVLVSDSGEQRFDGLVRGLRDGDGPAARILRTTDKLFGSASGTDTPQGIAALARPPEYVFEDLLRGGAPLVPVLVGVQDPGNVGTAFRSAEAFGATGAMATRGSAHPLCGKALRASAGSALRLPFLSGVSAAVAMAQLRSAGLALVAAASGGESGAAHSPEELDFRGPTAILIGGEGAGLPGEVKRSADAVVSLALAAGVESLNAGVAASVLLYVAARQRGQFAQR
jgi:RNA methyltransferase, TrmH family